MALVVEDGTGVSGANSYVTLDEAKAYAADRGLAVPVDATLTQLLIKAAEYIDGEPRGKYKGDRTYPSVDTMKWPRTGVQIDGYDVGEGEIPKNLKHAQIQAAIEMQTVDPTPTISGQVVKREKVDVIETEYAIDYKSGEKPPVLTKVNLLLRPLLRSGGMVRVSRA